MEKNEVYKKTNYIQQKKIDKKRSIENKKLQQIAEQNLEKYKHAFEVLGNGKA